MSRILIVGPAWVGDMVMAQSLFKLLKLKQPETYLDVLAPAWSLPLLARMPEVAKAIPFPIQHGRLQLLTRYQLGKTLQQVGYDRAIVLPNSFKSALVPWLAKIPHRTGWRGEMRYMVLNDRRRLDKKRYPRMVERFLALGLASGESLPSPYPLPSLTVSALTQQAVKQKYHLMSLTQPVVVLCPGAEYGTSKRWPPAYYAAVAREKIKEGWEVWILGSNNDQKIAQEIMLQTSQKCINFCGSTTLEEAIDILSLATVVISNDSGLMHIASALQKRLIVIYGSTSPVFTPPLQHDAKILKLNLDCQPCSKRVCPLRHHRCMTELLPERVLQAFPP